MVASNWLLAIAKFTLIHVDMQRVFLQFLTRCHRSPCTCTLLQSELAPKDLIMAIAVLVAKGGPDGRYIPVEGNAVQPWNSDTSWVVQAIHTTAKGTYNDTL